ncbi:MAG: hypothetical protein ABSG95_10605 [Solirubrobacteraceae bacterium]|jgi:hypothetical protein
MSSLRSVFGPQARVVWRLTLVLVLIALAVLALIGAIDSLQTGVLTMLPALALAVAMLTRPYLGERVIARLRARRPRRPSAVGPTVGSLRPEVSVARGGRLIAVALAGRAPPLAFAGCR